MSSAEASSARLRPAQRPSRSHRPAKAFGSGHGLAPGGLIPSSTMWSTVALSLTLSRGRDTSHSRRRCLASRRGRYRPRRSDIGQDRRFRGDGTDGPSSIAVGAGAVWVAEPDDKAIVRIGRSRLLTPIRLSASPTAVAVGEGAVWAVTTGDTLIRIDPTAAAVETTIRSERARPESRSEAARFGWRTVSKERSRRSTPAATPSCGQSTSGIVRKGSPGLRASSGAGAGARPAERRTEAERHASCRSSALGLRRIRSSPELHDLRRSVRLRDLLQLLDHPDAGAPTGTQLEPEAATSLPAVSRDKRSYTFTIRDGFRFSPPSRQTVTAERSATRSSVSLNPTDEVLRREHLRRHRRRPPFRSRTSTPHQRDHRSRQPAHDSPREAEPGLPRTRQHALLLRRADWNTDQPARRPRRFPLLARTTSPRSARRRSCSSATPTTEGAVHGGSTGSSSHWAGHRRRSPPTSGRDAPTTHWTASPARWSRPSRPVTARKPCRRGRPSAVLPSDPTDGRIPRPQHAAPALQPPPPQARSQLRSRPGNARQPRRAVQRSVGQRPSDPNRHFLPPGIRGYQDARTYPLRPDIRTAKRLAHGLRGTAIMYSCDLDTCDEVAQTVSANLKPLGIDVIIKRWPIGEMYARERAPREPFDLGLAGWSADYADGGAFLSALFEGSSIAKGSNTSRFAEAGGTGDSPSGPSTGPVPRTRVRRTRPRACQGRSPRCSRLPDAQRLFSARSAPDRTARRVRHRSRSSLHSLGRERAARIRRRG